VRCPSDAVLAVSALSQLHQGWVVQAGGQFRGDVTVGLNKDELCEISPLVSYEGEDLEGVFPEGAKGLLLDLPLHVLACGEEGGQRAGDGLEMRFQEVVDRGVAQAPNSSERLCQTPRWLRDEVEHWQEKLLKRSSEAAPRQKRRTKSGGSPASPRQSQAAASPRSARQSQATASPRTAKSIKRGSAQARDTVKAGDASSPRSPS